MTSDIVIWQKIDITIQQKCHQKVTIYVDPNKLWSFWTEYHMQSTIEIFCVLICKSQCTPQAIFFVLILLTMTFVFLEGEMFCCISITIDARQVDPTFVESSCLLHSPSVIWYAPSYHLSSPATLVNAEAVIHEDVRHLVKPTWWKWITHQ